MEVRKLHILLKVANKSNLPSPNTQKKEKRKISGSFYDAGSSW
jgi:exosome complex RNA-binding protein Csl4